MKRPFWAIDNCCSIVDILGFKRQFSCEHWITQCDRDLCHTAGVPGDIFLVSAVRWSRLNRPRIAFFLFRNTALSSQRFAFWSPRRHQSQLWQSQTQVFSEEHGGGYGKCCQGLSSHSFTAAILPQKVLRKVFVFNWRSWFIASWRKRVLRRATRRVKVPCSNSKLFIHVDLIEIKGVLHFCMD